MIKKIDYYLDRITMYRLVLYELIALIVVASGFGFIGLLPYSAISIILSALLLVIGCWAVNTIFSTVFDAPTNVESVYITALILALIINPIKSSTDLAFYFWVAVLSMSAKYILTIKGKHIFNPAAIAVVLTAFGINQSASWWVGNAYHFPFVAIGGYMIVRKIRKEDLVLSFMLTTIAITLLISFMKSANLINVLALFFLHSPLIFFGTIMLTEPLTTPPTRILQIYYGIITGLLYVPDVHIGSIYSTPELALIASNIFSYIVSPKQKLILHLQEKIQVGKDLYDYIFQPNHKLNFIPGQYLEWTLPHQSPDSRGNRRFFTLASSPTEENIRLGIKFYNDGSSYKKALLKLNNQTPVVASQLAGDFTLTKNPEQKYVFIAGGIGITPFRSIIKYLIDTGHKRDIILMYSNKCADEIVYKEIFERAEIILGMRTIYTLTDTKNITNNWQGKTGRINAEMINREIPDYSERLYYLSGPHAMVAGFENTLLNMGISHNQIKKDYFPGFV